MGEISMFPADNGIIPVPVWVKQESRLASFAATSSAAPTSASSSHPPHHHAEHVAHMKADHIDRGLTREFNSLAGVFNRLANGIPQDM
jgi:hypothetical protein